MGIAIAGAMAAVLYTPFFARIMLGELVAGLTLGSLVIIGGMVALSGNHTMPWEHFFSMALFSGRLSRRSPDLQPVALNEFPDREADRTGGRQPGDCAGISRRGCHLSLMNLAAFARLPPCPWRVSAA
jgi:1,4-dihydroxy-2-naphthoate octaprenyltransferase